MEHKSNHAYEILREAAEILESVPALWKQTCEDMRLIDLEISDIMHELEFEDFDEEKGNELALEIKRVRKNRRVVKEDQSAFIGLKDFCEKNSTFTKRLQDTVSSMQGEIEARARRIYTPKIRTDKMNRIYAEKAIITQPLEEKILFIEDSSPQMAADF